MKYIFLIERDSSEILYRKKELAWKNYHTNKDLASLSVQDVEVGHNSSIEDCQWGIWATITKTSLFELSNNNTNKTNNYNT